MANMATRQGKRSRSNSINSLNVLNDDCIEKVPHDNPTLAHIAAEVNKGTKGKLTFSDLGAALLVIADNTSITKDLLQKNTQEIEKVSRDLSNLAADVTAQGHEIKKHDKDIFSHETRLFHLEMFKIRNNIILRGVEPHKDASTKEAESWSQTQEVVRDIFDSLDIGRVRFRAFRLKPLKDHGKPYSIKVELSSDFEKQDIIGALTAGKMPKHISVSHEYPRSMQKIMKIANSEAYDLMGELKKENKGAKTRVVPINGKAVIQVRRTATDKWTSYKEFPNVL
jgi:hypothetical protein